jgi:hypothetical protein
VVVELIKSKPTNGRSNSHNNDESDDSTMIEDHQAIGIADEALMRPAERISSLLQAAAQDQKGSSGQP